MYALLLCLTAEPCVALSAARFDVGAAHVIATDTAARVTTWRAPATYAISTGRIDINLPPLMVGGFED